MPAIMKPSRLACAVQSEPIRGGGMTTVSAFALFDFAEPRRLLTEQALWPMVAEQMADGAIFDKGKLKPKGEFIVAGSALSPGDEPVMGCRVSARVGGLEKRLAVFGDRIWRLTDRGIELLEIAPFIKMPIGLHAAFGGPNHKGNPWGKGHGARRIVEAGYDAPLPNVEDAAHLIRSVDDAPVPAHFGPLAPDSIERMRYAGTYDRHWMKKVSPLRPDDFNPLFNCDAPEDQRLEAYFEGVEPFAVSGMSRGDRLVGGTLPGLRPRAFVHRPADDSFTEIRMVCDTVTLFPNVTKAVLAFRALAKGESRFGDDIGTVMLAVEHAEDAPRPADYYLNVFRLRSDPEKAHKHALSDFQLMPERDPSVVTAHHQAKLEKARQDRVLFQENQVWAARRMAAEMGVPPELMPPPEPGQLDDLPLVAMPADEEIENGEFDLAQLLDEVEALEAVIREKADAGLAKAELARRALADALPPGILPAVAHAPIVDDEIMARHGDLAPDDPFAAALAEIDGVRIDQISQIKAPDTEASRALQTQIDDIFAAMEAPQQDEEAAEKQFQQACARALKLPEGSLLHGARDALDGISFDIFSVEDGSPMPEAMVAGLSETRDRKVPAGPANGPIPGMFDLGALDVDPGQSEESRKQAGAALVKAMPQFGKEDDPLKALMETVRRIDPPGDPADAGLTIGQRIEKGRATGVAMLEGAEKDVDEGLAEARRSSPEAIFPMEPFADGVAARFGAFVAERLAEGHSFGCADLAGAALRGLDFSGLDLSGTFFEKADLTGANFTGTDLSGAAFTGATLDGADFTDADLSGANISQASLRGTRLDRCNLGNCTIIKANFSAASLRGATIASTTLMECILDKADLSDARIRDLQLLRGSADGFCADGAEIERAAFMDLSMAGASFSGSRLERIAFMQLRAPGASFAHARLDAVSFAGEVDMTGAGFEQVEARETAWNTVLLAESCFVRARCDACLFNACDMTACDLRLASLKGCHFGKSVLTDSDLFGANLFAGSLAQADLRRASLRGANLYSTDLLEAKLASCDLTGANLGKTLLEEPVHA